MLNMSARDIDIWDCQISLKEYIHRARTAIGPEALYAVFIEAKSNLEGEDYKLFRKETRGQYDLLVACGWQPAVVEESS